MLRAGFWGTSDMPLPTFGLANQSLSLHEFGDVRQLR